MVVIVDTNNGILLNLRFPAESCIFEIKIHQLSTESAEVCIKTALPKPDRPGNNALIELIRKCCEVNILIHDIASELVQIAFVLLKERKEFACRLDFQALFALFLHTKKGICELDRQLR